MSSMDSRFGMDKEPEILNETEQSDAVSEKERKFLEDFRAEMKTRIAEVTVGVAEYEDFLKSAREKLLKNNITGEEAELEIDKLWKAEPRKPKEMMELRTINVNDLTMEDAIMWHGVNNYKIDLITRHDFNEYYDNIERLENDSRASRIAFRAVIANKLTLLWGNEELEKYLAGK